MVRFGAMVRKLYERELKPVPTKETASTKGRLRRIRSRLTGVKKALTKRRTVVWIVRVAVILLALVIVVEAVFQFNVLMAWYTVALARRADVDSELKRRENLMPNLVSLISEYTAYERGVFKHVSDARETLNAMRSSGISGSKAASVLEKALSGLVALAEDYPDLKATQSIQDVIKEAANTENRIADAKIKYNKACEIYNQYRTTFPGNVFALVYRFKAFPYIGLEEEVKVPSIDLKITEPGVGARLEE